MTQAADSDRIQTEEEAWPRAGARKEREKASRATVSSRLALPYKRGIPVPGSRQGSWPGAISGVSRGKAPEARATANTPGTHRTGPHRESPRPYWSEEEGSLDGACEVCPHQWPWQPRGGGGWA